MNDRPDIFAGLGRHTPPEGLKRRIMDEVALTPQEGRAIPARKRTPLVRWFGWAALPLAVSAALWLALPAGEEAAPTLPAPVVAEAPDGESLLAALDDIYGVETTATRGSYESDTTLRTIYGIGEGTNREERNDA